MSFERVINGILRYLNAEIYNKMNSWQEVLARVAVSRMIGNAEELKQSLMSNSFFRTFSIIDSYGNVDVDGLIKDLKEQVAQKGKLVIALPMFGNFTFTAADIDELHRHIREGGHETFRKDARSP
jgi:hypothetical protein